MFTSSTLDLLRYSTVKDFSNNKCYALSQFDVFILLGISVLHLDMITAKIGYDNKPSIGMFMKLGFTEVCFTNLLAYTKAFLTNLFYYFHIMKQTCIYAPEEINRIKL